MSAMTATRRSALVFALRLEYFTIGWNVLEAVVGIVAGIAAGSVALVGFALDSVGESASGGVLTWRLHAEGRGRRAEEVERLAIRGVAVAFLLLAAYVAGRSVWTLVTRARPDPSPVGIALAAVSLVVMPILARRKRAAARALDSRSLQADSTQTVLCTLMSAFVLVGLGLNAVFGWWWADPVAGLVVAFLAGREGRELWTTEDLCCI